MTSGGEQRPPAARQQPSAAQAAKAAASQQQAVESTSPAGPAAPQEGVKSTRRLPGFFSSVARPQQQGEERAELERSKMRFWRARFRTTAAVESGGRSATPVSSPPKKATAAGGGQKTATPAGGTAQAQATTGSGIKPRHFLGLFIYVLAAFLVQAPIFTAMQALRLEVVLWRFAIASLPVVISTSTLVYIAAIIVILLILQHFDLIFLARRPPARTAPSSQKARARSTGAREAAKTTRGEHDDLYEDYRDLRRYLRRRARKR